MRRKKNEQGWYFSEESNRYRGPRHLGPQAQHHRSQIALIVWAVGEVSGVTGRSASMIEVARAIRRSFSRRRLDELAEEARSLGLLQLSQIGSAPTQVYLTDLGGRVAEYLDRLTPDLPGAASHYRMEALRKLGEAGRIPAWESLSVLHLPEGHYTPRLDIERGYPPKAT